jgi:leucyl-tRNA synthetase
MNTAIAQMMIFTNDATSAGTLPRDIVEAFLRLLSPYAPHICEEVWQRLGKDEFIAHAEWPSWDPELVRDETITIVVQVNGKKRDELQVERDTEKDEIERLALASENAQKFIDGKDPKKIIVVPGRLVNIVV